MDDDTTTSAISVLSDAAEVTAVTRILARLASPFFGYLRELGRFKSFVNFNPTKPIKIIVADTFPVNSDEPRVTPDRIRGTGEGQIVAIFSLLPWLARTYGPEKLRLHFAKRSAPVDEISYDHVRKTANLLILGGPITNNWAAAVENFASPQFQYGTEDDPHTLVDISTNGRRTHGRTHDYGLITQVPEIEDRGGHRYSGIMVLSGNSTRGTAGISQALARADQLRQLVATLQPRGALNLGRQGGCYCVKTTEPDGNTDPNKIQLWFDQGQQGRLHAK